MILSVFRVAPKQAHRGINGAFHDQALGGLTLNYLEEGLNHIRCLCKLRELKSKG